MAAWKTSSWTTVTRRVSTVSTVRLTAAVTTTCQSLIRGTTTGIGVLACITIRPTGRLVLACLTTTPAGELLIMDILGGDTITTITRRIITATAITLRTTTTATTIAILTTSTARMPAPTTASTATTCRIHTDTEVVAPAVTAAAITPATPPTMVRAAVLVV